MERFPFPIFASSMRLRSSNCVMWTWNWRPATTGRGVWRKKPPQASRSMGIRKTQRVCAAFSTNTKSPQRSSHYEHLSSPSQCSPSPRLHRSRSPLSLHRGDAFRVLRGTSIPGLHLFPLGQAHDHFLEQTSHQKTRPDRALSNYYSGTVYHLFSRRLYRQIDRENIRNRREHEIEYVQRRIGILDFVFLNQGYQYL